MRIVSPEVPDRESELLRVIKSFFFNSGRLLKQGDLPGTYATLEMIPFKICYFIWFKY
jgi:hypothetical protein